MIERKFVAANMKEFLIEEYISQNLKGAEHSKTKLQRTPLGDKVIIYSSRPGIIVGRKGASIKALTKVLKKRFDLENPQIEISEVENPSLDANIMAEKIVNSLERFGSQRFKGIGHRIMSEVMAAGAMGIEILVSGKVPSSRAKVWRFYQGYLKKCGDIALTGVHIAQKNANLKSGIVGIKVSIMPPDTKLPDRIEILEEKQEIIEEVKEGEQAEKPAEEKAEAEAAGDGKDSGEKKGEKPKKAAKKKAVKKKAAKKPTKKADEGEKKGEDAPAPEPKKEKEEEGAEAPADGKAEAEVSGQPASQDDDPSKTEE